MVLEGLNVVKYLNGPDTVRDGSLVNLFVQDIGTGPFIELTFAVPHKSGTRIVKLELRDVQAFDYGYTKDNPPHIIEFVKCLTTDTGDFYLSLDPYDEREAFISENDNEFFRARLVKLTTHDSV